MSSTTFSVTFLVLLHKAEQSNVIKDGVAKNIYRDVLTDLAPNFKLEVHLPSPKRSTQFYRRGGRNEPEKSKPSLMDGDEIATLIDNCRSLGLAEEMEALMSHVIASSRTIEASAFGSLVIPTLTRLIELSLLSGTPLKEPPLQFFVQKILDTYIQRYIGNEPAKPRDWARARRGCGCRDCQLLDNFLINPKEQVGRFAVAKARRAHLHNKLEASGFTHETERRGSPQTLVVTKNLSKWQSSHQIWRQRCSIAQQTFQKFGTANLEELLGERYHEIINLDAVKLAPAGDESSKPVATMSSPPLSAWHPAMVGKLLQRTPLGTAHQQNSRSNVAGPAVETKAAPRSHIQIVDLTAE